MEWIRQIIEQKSVEGVSAVEREALQVATLNADKSKLNPGHPVIISATMKSWRHYAYESLADWNWLSDLIGSSFLTRMLLMTFERNSSGLWRVTSGFFSGAFIFHVTMPCQDNNTHTWHTQNTDRVQNVHTRGSSAHIFSGRLPILCGGNVSRLDCLHDRAHQVTSWLDEWRGTVQLWNTWQEMTSNLINFMTFSSFFSYPRHDELSTDVLNVSLHLARDVQLMTVKRDALQIHLQVALRDWVRTLQT